jgi:predicted dehydrogenase
VREVADVGTTREINLGLIGLGAWGPNLLRTFGSAGGCRVRRVADLEGGRFGGLQLAGERPEFTSDYHDILNDPAIDAVAIATPSETHYRIGREALLAGKHLFVEKPLALSSREGLRLATLARERGRTLMVGHLLMYHPAVIAMAGLVRRGRIGTIRYLGIRRRAFGRLQGGCSVLWDLGPHDISIALMVTAGLPVAVSSLGRAFILPGLPEISFTAISLAGGALAHIEESWLAPERERQLLAVGDKGMLLFDELAADGAHLKHFAKAIKVRTGAPGRCFEYLDGGATPIAVAAGQPLAAECREFLECIRRRREPRAGGENAVTVLRVLEAAERSQRAGGRQIKVTGGTRS